MHDEKTKRFFKESDIFIFDRGFKDSIEYLKNLGFLVEMPAFLEKGTQFETEEANETRLVTKIRWVVEATNGLIKKWAYFDKVVSNIEIRHINKDFRIVCALINKYRESRVTDQNADYELGKKMVELAKKPNDLKEKVLNFKRKNQRKTTIDIDSVDFPQLTIEYIRSLTLGVYQIKQAKSYSKDHLNEDGDYEFEMIKLDSSIIKVKMNSRHASQTIYSVFIEYDKSDKKDPIKSWYCDCKVGARTVGCCSHIASVIWYFGLEVYEKKLSITNTTKIDSLCIDAARLRLAEKN